MSVPDGIVCPRCSEVNPPARRECWVCSEPLAAAAAPAVAPTSAARSAAPAASRGDTAVRDALVLVIKIIAIGVGIVVMLIFLLIVTCFGLIAMSH
jgi:hypothetical protein